MDDTNDAENTDYYRSRRVNLYGRRSEDTQLAVQHHTLRANIDQLYAALGVTNQQAALVAIRALMENN
jgi:hypothetical protein